MHFIKSNKIFKKFLFLIICLFNFYNCEDLQFESTAISNQNDLFTVVGRIDIRPEDIDLENTRILVDHGQHIAHLRADGSFSISGLTSNSYVIEVSSPKNYYEPLRVDITSKGKIRSRRLNLIQPNEIQVLKYPLNFESRGYPNYFLKREQFRIIDVLLSPMVLMMVVPLLLVVALPKLINQDPELQRELEKNTLLQPTQNVPDLSSMMNNFFGGGNTANRRTNNQRQQQQPRR